MYNSQLKQEITPLKSWDQKLDHFVNTSPLLRESAEPYKAFGVSLMALIKAILDSEWKYKNSIKSHTVLLKADRVPLKTDKDYGLSKVGVLYQVQVTLYFIVRCPLSNSMVMERRILKHLTGCISITEQYSFRRGLKSDNTMYKLKLSF
jgi:hypothetical protein